jgi:hypothetical protein
MPSSSNIYAEKIYSEHPSVLWALDDQADYISLLSPTNKNLLNWSTSASSSTVKTTSTTTQPFLTDDLFLVTGNPSTTEIRYTTIVSPDIINFTDLNQDLDSFCVGSYFYSNSIHIASISIGYEYYDVVGGITVQNLKEIPITLYNNWMFLSETFSLPKQNTTMRIVLKIGYYPSAEDSSHYTFLINGITLGQWSEEFNSFSSGTETVDLPSEIPLESSKAILSAAYGLNTNTAYYLVKNNSLVARNAGVPLIYGASNTTVLFPNSNEDGSPKPSLIVPGFGFLNEVGRYKTLTVEMWLRITAQSSTPKRIFGPISSSDGLYLDGSFLTLVIDGNFKSKYIGEWCRPMLIQVSLMDGKATVVMNGELIIDLNIDRASISLPQEYLNSKHQDWLGFYAYSDITPIELDCIAIYPYNVPEIIAKKRWVYGQAVKSLEVIDSSYNGVTSQIDYTFSQYANNYSYPNHGNWKQGKFDGLTADNTSLMSPEYSLPNFVSDDSLSLSEIFVVNKDIQNESDIFFTLGDNNGYLFFDSISFLTDKTKSFYGIFKIGSEIGANSEQTLMFFQNKTTLDHFKVSVLNNQIYYKLKTKGKDEITISTKDYIDDQQFVAGINIEQLSKYFGNEMISFWANPNLINLYLLNDPAKQSQYLSNMYKFGASTKRNFLDISSNFNERGIIDPASDLIDFVATYTLVPEVEYGSYYFDIDISGHWEDYIPLTYFAKNITDSFGEQKYDLDFIQFNIDAPSPPNFVSSTQKESWKYGELQDKFSYPSQRSYDILDNKLYTGYDDYDALKHDRSSFQYEYDTSKSNVRSYITFQYVSDGLNRLPEYFTTNAPALKSGIINLENDPNWMTTKYEVVNNTVIYPPKDVDFEKLAIVVYVEVKTSGTINKRINLKSLELASQSNNETYATEIGTRFGNKIYPYKKSGAYFDYKSKNPISIYKKSSPYLHLTRYSGIQVKGPFDPTINRGVGVVVNKNKVPEYQVGAFQIAMRYDEDFFPATPYSIFEIQNADTTIKFYMVANSSRGDRAKIYAIDSATGKLKNGISYYLNGILVAEPTITIKQWGFLGISFADPISFESISGYINLNGPLLFNNISYYKISNLQKQQSSSSRIWDEVLQAYLPGSPTPIPFMWDYWYPAYTWYGVMVKSTSYAYGITPSDIYKTYMGTNKIIVGNSGEMSLKMYDDPISVYSAVDTDSYILKPV